MRIYRDAEFFRQAASPSGVPESLLQFLVTRRPTTVDSLGCRPAP